jgi:hypothetical protein
VFSKAVALLKEWSGVLALFLVLTGGVAYAAGTIGSADVINNSLRSTDLKDGAAVNGLDVVDGSLGAVDLSAAALGARAYGSVASDGSLSLSKNAAVSHPINSVYCIALSGGIDPASAVLLLSPVDAVLPADLTTETFRLPQQRSSGVDCAAGQLEVLGITYDGDTTDNNDGSGNLTGDTLGTTNLAFTFVVP